MIKFLDSLPKQVRNIWLIGLILRLIGTLFTSLAPDYIGYRLPIAECISSGQWLYCDCAYNHTPFYPYLSGLLNLLSFGQPLLQSVLITLPLAVGDALVPPVIYLLFVKIGKKEIAALSATLYALNPIALIEVSIAHWDGFTTFFFLLSLYYLHEEKIAKSGFWAGMGVLLKQFPLAIVYISFAKDKNFVKTFILGALAIGVVLAGFLPFLLKCPETFFGNLSNHPLWKGAASSGVGLGTIKDIFENLGVPHAKIVWLIIFVLMLGIPFFRATKANYFYFSGLVMTTLAWFTYVTHRQLLIWVMPFLILHAVEKKKYVPLALVAVGYAMRIIKPDWYFGFFYLALGVYYYVEFWSKMKVSDQQSA